MHKKTRIIIIVLLGILILGLGSVFFTIFFDQAVIVRKGTIYRRVIDKKVVALTFDDGPSPEWTPKILDELK
ncbi:MAG TPA: polysaccharide deacetylase family protein, partial [Candidatus Margulisiibacteriota bacterium]|nr:polysaccharide deacetylase family protein [Candidatus Margulisiibacteriota bacterium]